MTHQNDYCLPKDLVEKGLDGVIHLLRVPHNNAMQIIRAIVELDKSL